MPLAHLDRVSVFETLRVYRGRLFLWEKHFERFNESCRALGRALPFSTKQLKEWLNDAVRDSGHGDATLRVSVHWDPSTGPGQGGGQMLLFLRPFGSHPAEWYEKGVSLTTAVARRPSAKAQGTQIKASNYVSGVLATVDAFSAPAAHEFVFLGPSGTVAEGTVSNLFVVKRKRLLTPSLASGILKGVTRGLVIDLARKRGWPVLETELTRHEFYSADECFLTNTSSEVLPVVRMDERTIGDGKPGPYTRLLGQDFRKLHE